MKVLQINVVYNNGSTGKIVYDIHTELLKDNIDSVVIFGRGKKINEKNVYKASWELIMKIQSLRSRITGYAYSGCIISTSKIIKFIKKEKPDVVHLHCLNGYFVNIYRLLRYLKINNIKTVLTLHAEFMYTAGCGYALECEKWKNGCGNCPQLRTERPNSWFFDRSKKEWIKMSKAFNEFNNLTICPVSDWLKYRAKQSPFLKDKNFETVTNGINTEIFRYRSNKSLKDKHKIKDEKIIIHVTSDFKSNIKGGKTVIEIAKKLVNSKVKFIIIGFNGDINELPENVIGVSKIINQNELAEYYSLADITLLTSKKETFSMVCAESLCCGTPIVGFLAGAPETITIKEYSKFVEQGNIDEIIKAINEYLHKEWDRKKIEYQARNKYSKKTMYDKYYKIYSK